MADITKNPIYMEGHWSAKGMIKFIEATKYESLENAIEVKTEVIKNFEEKFGYSRDMEGEIDSNYARELGMLDALTEAYEDT